MEMITIFGIAIISVVLTILMKQYRPEYGIAVGIVCGVFLITVTLIQGLPAIRFIENMIDGIGINRDYAAAVVKALGICYVAQFAADTCRDVGETAMASKVELAGKIAVVVLALPMLQKLMEIALGLINKT